MGIYVGLAPGGTLETWRHEAARLRVLLGHPDLPAYMRNAAQAQLNDLKRVIEMSQQNTNKQTPRPPFDPPSQTTPTDMQWEQLRTEYVAWQRKHPGAVVMMPQTLQDQITATLGYVVYEGEGKSFRVYPDGTQVEETQPATGPTTRLPIKCRRCHDTLPAGATFCIECGERV